MDSSGSNITEAGKYEFIKKLGEGGFGEVWLADDPARGRQVAVKFLRLKFGDQDEIDVFKREFEILSELKQIHLARVFDFGFSSENEQYYLSTEYCPGKSLLEAIEGKPVSYFEEVLAQILPALECIHAQGIIHFDIKPENVLVADDHGHPDVKLVDFGVAVKNHGTSERIGGTLAFTAPEVLQHSPKLDHRVDLYSLGMLCLLCLTKRFPFAAQDPRQVMEWHRSGSIPPQLWKEADVPRHLREITEKLLAKNPSERFSNSRVVLNFLNLATGGKYRQEEESLHTQIPAEGPIVERREEVLREVQAGLEKILYSDAAEALSSAMFLSGETGIGKSRILEEIRGFIQLKEIPYLHLECEWNVPTGPRLEKWLQTVAGGAKRATDALLAAAQKSPLALLIDDFHKADREMRELVFELAAQTRNLREAGQATRLFILAATDEPLESALRLKPLSVAGISSYLKLVLGESVPVDRLAEILHEYSGGLPLLMVEGLRYLAPHFLRGEPLDNLLAPAKIRQLYEAKLRSLKPEEHRLLATLALLFRPAGEAELENILGLGPAELAETATAAVKMGLIRGQPYGDPVYRVSSQALALDLAAGLEDERRRELHGDIARGLSAKPDAPLQELGYHFARAGDAERAAEYYRSAGVALEREGKIASAAECFKSSMDLRPTGSAEWERLALVAFRMQVLSGNYREAESFPAMLAEFPSWERDEILGWFHFKMRRFSEARDRYREALDRLPPDDLLHRILIENALGNLELQTGETEAAAARFQKTTAWEGELAEAERRKINNNNWGLSLSLIGKHDEAIGIYRERLKNLGEHDAAERLGALNGLGYSCLRASRYGETIDCLNQAMALAESSGAVHALFSVMGNLLTALLKENRYVEALSLLNKTASYQRRFGNKKDVAHNLLRQGSVYLMLGMGEFALGCFDSGLKLADEIEETVLAGWFLLMKAYWEREFGDAAGTAECLRLAEERASLAHNEELKAWTRYVLAEIAFDEGYVAACRERLLAVPAQDKDHEFSTRLTLLKAKCAPDAAPDYPELEAICRQNGYRELLWEVYQAWGNQMARSDREEAQRLFREGAAVIEDIASGLPEEYRGRYLDQKGRRKFFQDRERAAGAAKSGLFSRMKNLFG